MRQVIIYTAKEKELIRQAFIQAKKDHPEMSFEHLFTQANLILPEGRRRSAKGPSEIKWLQGLWIVTPGKKRKPHADAPVTQVPLDRVVEGAIIKSDSQPVEAKSIGAPQGTDTAGDKAELATPPQCAITVNPLEQIRSSLVPVLTNWLMPAMNDAVTTAMEHAFKEMMSSQNIAQRLQSLLHEQESKMKEQMRESTGKRILIVGLLPAQNELIKNEFGSCFRLKFASADDNVRHIENQVKFSDTVIGMTGKISHSVEATLKKHTHYVRVSGLLNDLRHTLTELYVNAD